MAMSRGAAAAEIGAVAPCAAAEPPPGMYPKGVRPHQGERQRLDFLKDIVERDGDVQCCLRTLVSAL